MKTFSVSCLMRHLARLTPSGCGNRTLPRAHWPDRVAPEVARGKAVWSDPAFRHMPPQQLAATAGRTYDPATRGRRRDPATVGSTAAILLQRGIREATMTGRGADDRPPQVPVAPTYGNLRHTPNQAGRLRCRLTGASRRMRNILRARPLSYAALSEDRRGGSAVREPRAADPPYRTSSLASAGLPPGPRDPGARPSRPPRGCGSTQAAARRARSSVKLPDAEQDWEP